MPVHRTFDEWDPADELDREAQAVLDLVDALADEGRVSATDELVASIDGYGVVSIDTPVAGQASLFLQAGDGWNRVLWTTASGRVFEWTWRQPAAGQQIRALLDGRATERTTFVGRRRLTSALVGKGETVSVSGGILRPIARLLPLPVRGARPSNRTPANAPDRLPRNYAFASKRTASDQFLIDVGLNCQRAAGRLEA
jgi:hypothetical protein